MNLGPARRHFRIPPSLPLQIIVAFVLPLWSPSAAVAGLGIWTTSGPTAAVAALAVDPQDPAILYAGAFDLTRGIFKSPNRGENWGLLISGVSIQALAVSSAPTTIYAGTNSGLLRSTDGGLTWSTSTDLANRDIRAVTTSLADPTRAYTGTTQGLFRSTNRGANWSSIPSFASERVDTVAVDPTDALRVFVGASGQLYRSTDGGDTWTSLILPSVPPAQPGFSLLAIAFAPSNPAIVYVSACVCVAQGAFVFKSTNRGATWVQTYYDPTGLGFVDLAVSRFDPSTIYAAGQTSLFRSTDGGLLFGRFDTGLPPTAAILSVEIDLSGTRLYAGAASSQPGSTGVFSYDILTCALDSEHLCLLDNRFRVSVTALDPRTGSTGVGRAIPQGNRHGSFSLPSFTGDPAFPEVIVKMLDATALPPPTGGYFWVFHTGLTDLAYTLTVTDTLTGATRTYRNDRSDPTRLCGGADTAAFPR